MNAVRIQQSSEPIDCLHDSLHWTGSRVTAAPTCADNSYPAYNQVNVTQHHPAQSKFYSRDIYAISIYDKERHTNMRDS